MTRPAPDLTDDRCPAEDHPVWMDGSQDYFRCELPAGHIGEHLADAVELVKTSAAMAARRVPSLETIAQELDITDGWSDAFEIDEWIRSGDEIECYGTTDEGLPFGFRIKVIAAWETDL